MRLQTDGTLVSRQPSLYNENMVREQDCTLNIDEIVAKYRPIISFKVKKSIGAHTPEWEDVVNEVLLNVIEKLEKSEFRGESSIGTFIYTITSRRIIDYIRRKSKVLKHAPEPNPYSSPHQNIEEEERTEHMALLLEQLKPKYKDVLHLYYYKDFSRDEVAELLNISPRRVSERVNYAQKLLKKMMKK
jgi:RNA polymerase sigma factor (sigma-70 family)